VITELINSIQPFVHQEIERVLSPFGEVLVVNNTLRLHVILLDKIKCNSSNTDLINFNSIQQSKTSQLICIYEDELTHKFDIIVSRVKSLLGVTTRIHGRSTAVVKLTKPELLKFLNDNHGNEPFNAKYKYGLVHNNELVAVASFGQLMHKKFEKGGKWSGELIRFCNKNEITVVGGLSKLIKHFIKQHKVDDVMTYADKDWSDGKSYLKLGFKLVNELPPVEFFVDSKTLERFNYRTKTSTKNPLISIFTSGSLKFILAVKNEE
jgi:hypothetical protein